MWTLEKLFLTRVLCPNIAALSDQRVLISFPDGSTIGPKILYGEYVSPKSKDAARIITLKLENGGSITITQHGGEEKDYARIVLYHDDLHKNYSNMKIEIGSVGRCICEQNTYGRLIVEHSPGLVLGPMER